MLHTFGYIRAARFLMATLRVGSGKGFATVFALVGFDVGMLGPDMIPQMAGDLVGGVALFAMKRAVSGVDPHVHSETVRSAERLIALGARSVVWGFGRTFCA